MSNIILVGYQGSGKTSIANIIANCSGYSVIEFGDVVRASYELNNKNNKSLIDYANDIMKSNNLGFVKLIKCDRDDGIIFVGPRTIEEVEYLCRKYDIYKIVGLKCEKKLRFERRRKQKKYVDEDYLKQREVMEYEWGLNSVMKKCDYTFDTSKNTINEISEIINFILKK